MIIGIGNDLCDCRRIEATIGRHGQRFLDRIFTKNEQARILKRNQQVASFAKLFSAKEAVAKALGTGLTRGISWTDIEITRQEHQPPQVLLHNNAKTEFAKRIPMGMDGHVHLTITDEWPYAQAFAILSATPKNRPI
ncbi:holo-ACP synthase [Candidatus Paracaedibacter symbiosus]|uniref:holo-ACP synthase n=1 Tax=Candidatus Paracaedibacter symbiosus TaxID=244582 RepID=UPI00050973BE|nr:holo-ACP synthase [Candidatus Paracaedibacter symbiosus]